MREATYIFSRGIEMTKGVPTFRIRAKCNRCFKEQALLVGEVDAFAATARVSTAICRNCGPELHGTWEFLEVTELEGPMGEQCPGYEPRETPGVDNDTVWH